MELLVNEFKTLRLEIIGCPRYYDRLLSQSELSAK